MVHAPPWNFTVCQISAAYHLGWALSVLFNAVEYADTGVCMCIYKL